MKNLIEELNYAKALHKEALKKDEEVLGQKDFVISILKEARPKKEDVERAVEFVTWWKETHENWIELIETNKKWAKTGGSVEWQERWIKTYELVLEELQGKLD